MSFILKLPSINAPDDAGKIEEIRRYLYTTVKEINWALNALDGSTPNGGSTAEVDGNSVFSVIKPLIMRNADIINTYYNIIKGRLDDVYASKQYIDNLSKLHNTYINGSITMYAEECMDGFYPVNTDEFTTDLPEGYDRCSGYIQVTEGIALIHITNLNTGEMANNIFADGEWGGWNLFPAS